MYLHYSIYITYFINLVAFMLWIDSLDVTHYMCVKYLHTKSSSILIITVYTKIYNLMAKRKWCVATYDCARARTCCIRTTSSVYCSVYHALPRTDWIFLVFRRPITGSAYSGSVPFYRYTLLPWYRDRGCFVFHSGMSVTGLPRIRSSIQPEKIEKRSSESNCHEETTQDKEFVART